jgi:ELWxxDGT repeat protein
VNNTLFFTAIDNSTNVRELWKSDGTEAGTIKVKSMSTEVCSATGSILREYWSNVTGTIANIPTGKVPTSSTQLSSFEAPSNVADNYGQRVRGYICAPASGNYTFYIAGDDNSELYLSTDEEAENKRLIASVIGWTSTREWTKYPSQKSVTIALEAGRKYYIEALHKEVAGGDRLAVGWVKPGGAAIEVIPGAVLSPYISQNAARLVSTEATQEVSMQVYPNPSNGERIQVGLKGIEINQMVNLSLYNSLGTIVLSQQVIADEAGAVSENLSLSAGLPSGIYILKAESGNKTSTQRIVIHK